TIYSLKLVLVGGYVNIYGENGSEGSPEGAPTSFDERRSMAHKPRLVQAAVIVAGIVMNLLFGWLLLSGGYLVGLPTDAGSADPAYLQDPAVTIVYVVPGSPAEAAGLEAGDK